MRYPFVILAIMPISACETAPAIVEPPVVLVEFANPTSQETSTLTAASLTSATRTTELQDGSLERSTDTFTVGAMTGEVSADGTEVALIGGGIVEFDAAGNTFSTRFTATPQSGDVVLGVVGVVSPEADIPTSGSATYTGTSVVTIQDDFTLYDLSGDATVAASFGDGTVTTTVDGLSGTATAGLTNPVAVTDLGTISFTGSAISGATYSDGTPQITSDTLSSLTSGAQSSLDGAFYGPDASETGGVFVIEDSTRGEVTIFGDFIAN